MPILSKLIHTVLLTLALTGCRSEEDNRSESKAVTAPQGQSYLTTDLELESDPELKDETTAYSERWGCGGCMKAQRKKIILLPDDLLLTRCSACWDYNPVRMVSH